MEGTKHIVECHCVLPQYRAMSSPLYHKFIVFSIIDDSDTVVPKFVTCNNCGVVHKVFDICKSEIVAGRDELNSEIKKDDIKFNIPSDIREVLESYNCDISTYENVIFILDNKKWNSFVVLTKDSVEDDVTGKMLVFQNRDKFKIESFTNNFIVEKKL